MCDLIKYIGNKGFETKNIIPIETLAEMTKAVLADYIDGMESGVKYDIDDYLLFDSWLASNPCVWTDGTIPYDKEYSSLNDLSTDIIHYLDLWSDIILIEGWDNFKKSLHIESAEEYNRMMHEIDELFGEG